MSKLTDIQKQYQDYIAAVEEVEKNKPTLVKMVYEKNDSVHSNGTADGVFIYDPERNGIEITPDGHYGSCVYIKAASIPSLIKALRDFFE